MEPIDVIAARGTVVNANPPASVAGGNVETSQRIVDVLFKALAKALPDRIPAASQIAVQTDVSIPLFVRKAKPAPNAKIQKVEALPLLGTGTIDYVTLKQMAEAA